MLEIFSPLSTSNRHTLHLYVNNIYNKLVELQQQIQHHDLHMNSGDTIQIEALDFDPDIDDVSPTTTAQESNNPLTQGSASPAPKTAE